MKKEKQNNLQVDSNSGIKDIMIWMLPIDQSNINKISRKDIVYILCTHIGLIFNVVNDFRNV